MLNHQIKRNGNKAIIFVHGNSSSLGTWNDVVNSTVLANYTLISIDLPGHGKSFRSTEPKKDYTIKGMALHLKEFISNFNKEAYIIVANSLGANLVGEIAADALTNCKGIMLIASSAVGKNLTVTDIIKPNPNVGALFIPQPTDEQIDLLIGDLAYNINAQQKEFIKYSIKNTDPHVRVQIAASVGAADYTDELQNIEISKIPVAVVFGAEEKLCFTDYLDKIPFAKWQNKTFLIPDCGHFSQIDQPQALSIHIKKFAEDCF